MTGITKNSCEVLRVTRDEFKGHDMINVRVFYGAGEGDRKPGKQGVALNAALLPDVIKAMLEHQKAGS
jgi:hypothetical protein